METTPMDTAESATATAAAATPRPATTSSATTSPAAPLPTHFVDAHQHFLDTGRNAFQGFLGSLVGPSTSYLPADYARDVSLPLAAAGVTLVGTVHVECLPNDGAAEAAWVQGLSRHGAVANADALSPVAALVASCDLAQPRAVVDAALAALVASHATHGGPPVRGVRWILDADGPFDGTTVTHVGVTRHDPPGLDYLRGHEAGILPAFAAGYARLAAYQLSFDLQCAPAQLLAAAALAAQHPDIPVAINHLGKPWDMLCDDGSLHQTSLTTWRTGMAALARLPHVYCKISMLGYAVPDWSSRAHGTQVVQTLVREVVTLFGADRCMVALNWWKDAATSDADGRSARGPSPVAYLQHCSNFLAEWSPADRDQLFYGTARQFYRIPDDSSRVA
jgi:predicted TIM-barrel fold metal-dependent hydrolase